ncbi:MAG: hypothetical protein H6865_00730 [Rhodospirillales bacterium]|nr:hypothetical protein [Alphaproteobacteria bacterium]MCB9986152.1 hypothetical protein [Rhodospirillales bacterium]USO07290.1 MAG: hypothetical protein H6866_07645 [Rhodospirillales bacterium]
MKHRTLILLSALTALTFILPARAARAQAYVWQDPVYGIKVTYPDDWMRQAQLDDNMRLFVLAPQGMDHASCRLYASHDGRFMDAPAYAQSAVSASVFNAARIRQEMYDRPDASAVRVLAMNPNNALGSGAAVLADISFVKNWAGGAYPMTARMMATQFHGTPIVMTCETLASAWGRWQPVMRNIFADVRFPPAFTPQPFGLYRPFTEDGMVYLPLNRRSDAYTAD